MLLKMEEKLYDSSGVKKKELNGKSMSEIFYHSYTLRARYYVANLEYRIKLPDVSRKQYILTKTYQQSFFLLSSRTAYILRKRNTRTLGII